MTHEEIVLKINDYEHEIGSLKHRVKKLEEVQQQIYNLTFSVKELAMSVQSMVEEQKEQGEKIRKLEEKPAENWHTVQKSILTTIIGTVVGAVVSAIIYLMSST